MLSDVLNGLLAFLGFELDLPCDLSLFLFWRGKTRWFVSWPPFPPSVLEPHFHQTSRRHPHLTLLLN